MSMWDNPVILLILALLLGLAYGLAGRSGRQVEPRWAAGALIWSGLALSVGLLLA